MALIDDKTLLKLPVYTKSGIHLGKVAGFELETESQVILKYMVRSKGITARMLKAPFLIGREQVVSITAKKMTVDDSVEKEVEIEKAKIIGLVSETEA